MVYIVPYEADYECPRGHKFVADANPIADSQATRCPACYQAWIDEHVPKGERTSKPREVPTRLELL